MWRLIRCKNPLIGARTKLGRRAVAAVEFAIIAPVLLILFVGTAELLLLYRTEAKLNALAANIAQMVSIQALPQVPLPATSNVATSTLGDICTGAVYGLQPFPPKGLTVAIVSMTTKVPGSIYDIWEVDNPGGGCAPASAVGPARACTLVLHSSAQTMLPTAITGASGDNMIIVRATLAYPGIVGIILGNTPTFTQTAFARWVGASSTSELACAGPNCLNSTSQICS